MCKNIIEPDRPQMTMWRMCVTWWIPNATNTHLEYVTVIALPLRQWLHELSLLLLYTYIACLLSFVVFLVDVFVVFILQLTLRLPD